MKHFCLPAFFFALVIVSLPLHAQTQNRTLTGRVVSANDNMGIPFANVLVKGTSTNSATDVNGNFSIEVPADAKQLEVSFLGFKTSVIDITGSSSYTITMKEDAQNLDEVVVIGYGTQRKSHLTGSISKINDNEIKELPVSMLGQALIGKVAGLNISNITSEAGVTPSIRIRGVGSITASSEPLVVVDGVPIQDGLNFVEASDVESVEILKDAASTAIYGSRGANGVILVTTKGGQVAKPKYTFTTTQGYRRPYKLNERYTYTEYVNQLYRERDLRRNDPQYLEENGYTSPEQVQITNQKNMNAAYILENQIVGFATNWEELSMRDFAYNGSYQLSVSGGTKDVKYYISGNYSSDEGIMVHSQYDKISFRAKIDATLSKYVKVGVNLNPSYSKRERPFRQQTDYTRWWSCFPVYHTQETVDFLAQQGIFVNVGDYTQAQDFAGLLFTGTTVDGEYWSDIGTISTTKNTQPAWINNNGKRLQDDYRLQSSAYVDVNIYKGLTFRSTNSVYVSYLNYSEFKRTDLTKIPEMNQATERTGLTVNFLTENLLHYNTIIKKHHNISAVAGITYQTINYKRSQIVGQNFPTENIQSLNQATEILPDQTWTVIDPARTLASYLARANYAYRDKYLFSASIRADGSSRFGPENKWGWFPSVSVGWRLSEEDFIASQKAWLDQLKLRVSWGLTGNDDIAALAYEDIISSANYELGDGDVVPGMSPTDDALGNAWIGWEQTSEWNAGFDFSVFGGRIGLTGDFYYAITDGLLLKQTSMAFTGHNLFWNNIGTVRNKGLEFELSTVNVDMKNFKWKTSFNISHNSPRLLGLGGETQLINQGENFDEYISLIGEKPIQYYGYKTDGVWISMAEINEARANGLTSTLSNYFIPGGLKIVDVHEDGIINELDRTTIGDPYPDFIWSITNSFSFFGVDISIMLQGVQGVEIYNDDGRYNENVRTSATWNTPDRWVSPNNPGDGYTPFEYNGFQKGSTDYVIENGSFLSIRNITVGYTLPSKYLKKIPVKGFRIYLTAENPLYVWNIGNKDVQKYRGINPEARKSNDNPLMDGLQNGSFAIQSSYAVGISLTF
ncbi:MAG: TonB-dependent receptor [Bacteroidales bacterium]|jgi:TonB-linked SusC/RagA family outer membrane protein|nr:TonB-dependent receptor [Bacteroidales bacterium]